MRKRQLNHLASEFGGKGAEPKHTETAVYAYTVRGKSDSPDEADACAVVVCARPPPPMPAKQWAWIMEVVPRRKDLGPHRLDLD